MNELQDIIGSTINNALQTVLEGARTDIHKYAHAISIDLIQIMQETDLEVQASLKEALIGQVRMLAELNRVRATAAAWQTASAIIDTALSVGLAALSVSPPAEG